MGPVSLRYQQSNGRTYDNQIISHLKRKNREKVDEGDGTTLVKITGCEYKISGESLSEALSHRGSSVPKSVRKSLRIHTTSKDQIRLESTRWEWWSIRWFQSGSSWKVRESEFNISISNLKWMNNVRKLETK